VDWIIKMLLLGSHSFTGILYTLGIPVHALEDLLEYLALPQMGKLKEAEA